MNYVNISVHEPVHKPAGTQEPQKLVWTQQASQADLLWKRRKARTLRHLGPSLPTVARSADLC